MKKQEMKSNTDESNRTSFHVHPLVPSTFGFSGLGANRRMGPIVLLPTLLRDLRGEVFPASRARGMFGNDSNRDMTIADGLRNEVRK